MIKIVNKEDKQLTLSEMQSIVGGRIERYPAKVKIDERSYEVIVNEEGLIEGLPINQEMLEKYAIPVCGNAILIEGGLY